MDQTVIAHLLDCHPAPPLLTAKQTAYVLNLQLDTVRIYRLRHPDRLPFTKVKGRFFYRSEDVIAFASYLSPRQKAKLNDLIQSHPA